MNTDNSQKETTEMETYLESIMVGISPPMQKILSALKDPLINYSSTSDQSASVAIASCIDQNYPRTGSAKDAKNYLWNLWFVIFNIVRRVPADHLMQDVLVGALNNLCQHRRDDQ